MPLIHPPPPPRRTVPPPPAQKYTVQTVSPDYKDVINSRIGPPPIPPRSTRPKLDAAELARALARRPPPPPKKKSINTPTPPPPPPRLPPKPVRVASSPPPQPKRESTNHQETVANPLPHPYDNVHSCLKCYDFSEVDAHAACYPRHTVTSLDILAYDLTAPFPSETEKARAIFTWLHYNIAYDAGAFFSGNLQPATPETTWQSGLAVCDGYAGLFSSLAQRVGLQVHKVTGHGKGFGYVARAPHDPVPSVDSNHAWNCVFMDGQWQLIDSCWGAGVLNGATYDQRFAPVWFTSTPAEFGRRHYPTDPSYQLIPDDEGGPISWRDYILEAEGPIIFQDFYKQELHPYLIQPNLKYIEGARRINFQIFKRCEHMPTAESDNPVYIIITPDGMVPLELNSEGGWSTTLYVPKGIEVSLCAVTEVDGKNAYGLGVQGFKKANGRKAMQFGVLTRWDAV